MFTNIFSPLRPKISTYVSASPHFLCSQATQRTKEHEISVTEERWPMKDGNLVQPEASVEEGPSL